MYGAGQGWMGKGVQGAMNPAMGQAQAAGETFGMGQQAAHQANQGRWDTGPGAVGTDQFNADIMALQDKQLAGTATPEELAELQAMQNQN